MTRTSSAHSSATDRGEPTSLKDARLFYRLMWGLTLGGSVVFVFFLIALGLWGDEIESALDSSIAESELQLAKDYEALGHFDKAIESYTLALTRTFRYERNWYLCGISLGDLLMRLQRFGEAIEIYAGLPEEAFESAGAYAGYVTSLHRLGNLHEAESLAKRWLETAEVEEDDLQRVWAHTTLGKIYQEMGRLDEAVSSYEKASDIDPSSSASKFARQLRRQLEKNADSTSELRSEP